MEHAHQQKSYAQQACPSLFIAVPCHPISIQHLQCSLSIEFLGAHNLREFHKTERELTVTMCATTPKDEQNLPTLRGHTFYQNQNLLQTQIDENGILRNMNKKGILWYPFIFVLLPCFSSAITQQMMTLKKRERQRIIFIFLFMPRYNSFAKMCAYQDVKYKQLSQFCVAYSYV